MQKEIDSALYDRDYYLSDNEGCREYQKGLDDNIHPKFAKALELAEPKKGDMILDVGCGRGEMLYYCARKGAFILGLDYSKDAIDIARSTIQMLPTDLRHLAKAEVGDAVTYPFSQQYDIIYMLEVYEHMNDRQLASTFQKFKKILKHRGRIVITTPSYYYEKYLQPLKMALDLPFRFLKWSFRVVRGKYRPKNFQEFLVNALKIKVDRGEKNRQMHANVSTPGKIKDLLKADFDVRVWCEDPSMAPVSLLLKKWWGRQIIAIAREK